MYNNNLSGYVGGIAGGSDCEGTEISYCYNMGNINSVGNWTGGIAGDVTRGAKIKYCYNKGTIVTEQESNCDTDASGGIVGATYYDFNDVNSNGKINEVLNCYNLGNVLCKNSRKIRYIGGIIGIIQKGYARIDNSYNQATVSASTSGSHLGGIIGLISNYPQITVTNCASGIAPAIGTNQAGNNETIINVLGGQSDMPNILSVINASNEEKFKEDRDNINEVYPILNWQTF